MKRAIVYFLLLVAQLNLFNESHAFTTAPSPARLGRKRRNHESRQARIQVNLFPDYHLLAHVQEIARTTPIHLLKAYGTLLADHPLTTKSATAAILSTVGDAIAQTVSHKDKNGKQEYDWMRGLTFFTFGGLYTGAFQHYWFDYLGTHIPMLFQSRHPLPVEDIVDIDEWWTYFDVTAQLEQPPSAATLAATKVAINQFLMVPAFYMPLFFAVTGPLNKLNWDESWKRAKSLYLPILQRNYFYWLPVQFLQFALLPPDYQIPFVALASLVWTIVLSLIGSGSVEQEEVVAMALPQFSEEEQAVLLASSDVTELVSLEDVENALIPDRVSDVVKGVLANSKVTAASSGLIAGLVVSSTDDGALGEVVGDLVNSDVDVGVVVVAAVGAAAGLLTAPDPDHITIGDDGEAVR